MEDRPTLYINLCHRSIAEIPGRKKEKKKRYFSKKINSPMCQQKEN